MDLYLVRHGAAMDRADPACPKDSERPLTADGALKTRQVAEGLRVLGLQPDRLLSSPYRRALETARIMARALGFPEEEIEESEALLPGSDPAELFAFLQERGGSVVLCFGHAPHLDHVIARALNPSAPVTSLKKAGVAHLEIESLAPLRAELAALYPPKVLRALAKA
ncbi:MAG: phosphohistidine phosphatase SixA [Planctomycetota bacterium]